MDNYPAIPPRQPRRRRFALLFWLKILAIVVALVVAVVLITRLYRAVSNSEITIGASQQIDITPQQIQSIKAIGQWEFLTVSDEELIDTVRSGFFSDDRLSRIYYGTMRLGIDMHQAEPGWIVARSDSLCVSLPPIRLLDSDFIDEARTKSFFQSGRWTATDREAMFHRAHRRMLSYGLTSDNILLARKNGEAQVRQVLGSMGFKRVHIEWRSEEHSR